MQAIPPLVWILLGSIAMGVIIGVPYVLIRRWWRRRNGLPPDEASPERVADTTRLRPAHAGWAALVAGGVALAWFSAWPMDWGRITLHTVLLTAMLLVAAYMVIKGRPTTSRTLKELALCSPLCVFGLLCFINQRADTSVARRYEVRVLAIEASKKGKGLWSPLSGSGRVRADIKSWRGNETEQIPVGGSVKVGDMYVVHVREGALGYPWF